MLQIVQSTILQITVLQMNNMVGIYSFNFCQFFYMMKFYFLCSVTAISTVFFCVKSVFKLMLADFKYFFVTCCYQKDIFKFIFIGVL